jgi:hypothetical protein
VGCVGSIVIGVDVGIWVGGGLGFVVGNLLLIES